MAKHKTIYCFSANYQLSQIKMVHISKNMDNYNQSGYGYEQSDRTVVGDFREKEFIVVSNRAKNTLASISKWVKFLAILGIIGCAFLIIVGIGAMLFGGLIGSKLGGGEVEAVLGASTGLIYIILGIIYIYPLIKMLNYANKMKTAIMSDSQIKYEQALANFNTAVKFWGVLAIIGLIIWGLILIFTILGFALF
ncbi:MAG: hypothetical protein J5529_02190 [Prevotella sp.]|nr:hypothetical protein [Prevotella sp.]